MQSEKEIKGYWFLFQSFQSDLHIHVAYMGTDLLTYKLNVITIIC